MRKALFTVLVFAKIGIRRYFRDRLALFFTIVFPLIFLFVFGGIFGKNSSPNFRVALINQSQTGYAQQFSSGISQSKVFKVKTDVKSLDQAQQKMGRSELDAAIVIPPEFGTQKAGAPSPGGQAVVYYDQNNQQAADTIKTVLDGLAEHFNAHIVMTQTPFTVRTQSTNQAGLSRFDYTFSGLLGFSIIGLGIFGPVNYFPVLKKQGVLRRLHVTPLRVWQYFTANVLSNAVIGLFSIGIMFLVALSVFHFHMRGNWLELAAIIVLGILEIFGIGLAIGGWAKNENQAAPLANIVVFPMMFLTGVFFPRFLMPEWLQQLSGYLPLTPVIDSIRMIITENQHLIHLGTQLGLMAVWTVIIYAIAFRVFRWE